LCDIEWYTQNEKNISASADNKINSLKGLLICCKCYEEGRFSKNLTKDDFEFSNFFNIVCQKSEGNNHNLKKIRLK
jgi:hypothetical protein